MDRTLFGRGNDLVTVMVLNLVNGDYLNLIGYERRNVLIKPIEGLATHVSQRGLHQVLHHSKILLHFRSLITCRIHAKVEPRHLTLLETVLNDVLDAVDPVVSQSVDCTLNVTVVLSLVLLKAY